MAVLLDGVQAAALDALPFADQLEVVHRSEPLPGALLCRVDGRVSDERMRGIAEAMVALDDEGDGEALLESLHVRRFEPLSPEQQAALRRGRAAAVGS